MRIVGGLVALPGENCPIRADITIDGGVITALTLPETPGVSGNAGVTANAGATANPAAGDTINAHGLLVFPGVIDPHVHFNDPGYTEREDFAHGTAAAASGGVTTIIDMPCTSVPPVTSMANLEKKLTAVGPQAHIDFGFYGGISGQVFEAGASEAMEELAPRVLGFKCYFVSGMETFNRLDAAQFLEVLRIARSVGRPILVHAEDADFVAGSTKAALAGGGTAPEDYYHSRPEPAEILAVRAAAELAEVAWGCEPPVTPPVHIVHVSTWRAAKIIGESPYLSGETGPQYLAFTTEDFARIGGALKITPPVKPAPNNRKLWEALQSGELSFVASDHAPAPTEQKNTGSVWTDYAGIPGSPTLFPYLYSEGYEAGRLTLSQLTELTSGAAARRYGIAERKGAIMVGMDADLVMVDPDAEWTVHGSELLSKGTVTPFEDMRLKGKVMRTIVRGRTVYTADDGIVGEPGWGRFTTKEMQAE